MGLEINIPNGTNLVIKTKHGCLLPDDTDVYILGREKNHVLITRRTYPKDAKGLSHEVGRFKADQVEGEAYILNGSPVVVICAYKCGIVPGTREIVIQIIIDLIEFKF